jgi:bifunctional non-homologous end joining protein LigD
MSIGSGKNFLRWELQTLKASRRPILCIQLIVAKSVKGRKSPMPRTVAPMLCTLTKEPVTDPEYLFEIKWDGFRIISYVQKKQVRMNSRSALDYTHKYPLIVDALKSLGHDVILDGEVVVFNAEGLPDFDALQLYNGHASPISYCVFDVLWMDGYDLMDLPLVERKEILKGLLKNQDVLRFSESFDDGPGLYKLMVEKNLEGIVAKRKTSEYRPGARAYEWLKTPTRKRQEFVIGGWAESENGRAFRSLLFGAYEGKELKWIGRSGGGYKQKEMPAILKKLRELETSDSPFSNKVLDTKGAVIHWVKPELVANFEFATWTKSGRIRKPATFLGFRHDKKPAQVFREIPQKAAESSSQKKKQRVLPTSTASNWPEVENQSRDLESEVIVDDCAIQLFSVHRQIWKDVTKAQLLQYYNSVAELLLPHVFDRPQSLHIKLHGPTAPGLYIKDMEGRQPSCASVYSDVRRNKSPGKRAKIDYLLCNNKATLLWMINLGCIDINPWSSRTADPLHPDYLIIDLDPSEKERSAKGLTRLRETAMAAKEFIEGKSLQTFIKTSGKTGIHFLIPCSGFGYKEARTISEEICAEIHKLVPEQSTISNSINQRGDKVYIDPSQNDYADTIAAPYCARPYYLPTISTPLEKREVNASLDPHTYTINSISKRIQKKGDLFAKLRDPKIVASNNRQLKKI